jgi:leucyl aminopeptidase
MNKFDKISKDLGSLRLKDPRAVLAEIEKVFAANKYSDYQVLNGAGFPLLNAVSKGGKVDPIVLILNQSRVPKAKKILIGKGIVFDSGGVQSKGSHMDDMFFDKLGATTVIATALKNRNVPGLVFLANNLVSETSYVCGEVYRAYDNKTNVIIDHTDAEGRLGLADMITFAKEISPNAVPITIATLTGAASYFSSENVTALLHTTNKTLAKKALVDDNIELFPANTSKKYDEAVKSSVEGVHLSNSPNFRGAGSQTAYSFLKHFNEELIHVDMAAMGVKDGNPNGWGIKELEFLLK